MSHTALYRSDYNNMGTNERKWVWPGRQAQADETNFEPNGIENVSKQFKDFSGFTQEYAKDL